MSAIKEAVQVIRDLIDAQAATMSVEQIEALKLMIDSSENLIETDEVIAIFENESIRLMDAAADSEHWYQALKASVDASESMTLSMDDDSKPDSEIKLQGVP